MDNRSISQTVGILMMLLITVILVTAIFKLSNVYFHPSPNVMLDVEAYTVDKANATKIYVRHLGGDPLIFNNEQMFLTVNGRTFKFHPFTKKGVMHAGDEGVEVVPVGSKVGQEIWISIGVGGMSLFSGEWGSLTTSPH